MSTCPPGRQRAQCQASPQVEPKSLKSSGFPAPNPGGQCHYNYHYQLWAARTTESTRMTHCSNIQWRHLLRLLLVARGHCIAGSIGSSHRVAVDARRQQQQHQQHRCHYERLRHLGGRPERSIINHGPLYNSRY